MKFSFVLPVYNAEKTLGMCMDSILNQTYRNLELICVDDCSQDASSHIITEYMKKDSRVFLIRNDTNLGTLCSRKKAVLAANGDYILFADNDDAYNLNACEILLKELNDDPTDILMYGVEIANNKVERHRSAYTETSRLLKPIPEKHEGENCVLVKNRISLLWNKAVKGTVCKAAYEHAEDIFLTISEDRYASYLIHYYAKSFRTIQEQLYSWNTHTGISTRSVRNMNQYEALCRCMRDSSRAIASFFETKDPELLSYFCKQDGALGYCIDEWYKTVETDLSSEAIDILRKYYDDDLIMMTMHQKINYWRKQSDNYKSLFALLCESIVFRAYYFICRKITNRFNGYCV